MSILYLFWFLLLVFLESVLLLLVVVFISYPHRVCATLPPQITIGQKTGKDSYFLLSKINFTFKSWEYDFTADYYVILGLKVISRQFEILPFNLTFLFQSLCSLWFLNTWSSSLLASLSSSSLTSPLESSFR